MIDHHDNIIELELQDFLKGYALNKLDQQKKIYFSKEFLANILREKGVTVKYNIVTKRIDFIGLDLQCGNTAKKFMIDIENELTPLCKKIDKYKIRDYMFSLAVENQYNPVLDLIKSVEWDRKDRLEEIFEVLGVTDIFSQRLIQKWFCQGISLLHNTFTKYRNPYGMLVLQGGQGWGKTKFFEKLAIKSEWFGEGRGLDGNDKDKMIRSLNVWICEFGELESTLRKSQIEDLKRFITSGKDFYRKPYGFGDEEHQRITNLCATCNSEGFLVDQTGNRRFWTVKVSDYLDWNKLNNIDMVQLWRQAYETTIDDLDRYVLSKSEVLYLEQNINANAMKELKGESEVRDVLADILNDENYIMVDTTVTEWKSKFKSLDMKYSSAEVGRVLRKLGYESKNTKRNGKRFRLITLPQKFDLR